MGCFESLDNTLEREIRSAEEIIQFGNYNLDEVLGAFYGVDEGNGYITGPGIKAALRKLQWLNPSEDKKAKYKIAAIRDNIPFDWTQKLELDMSKEKRARFTGCECLSTILGTIEIQETKNQFRSWRKFLFKQFQGLGLDDMIEG